MKKSLGSHIDRLYGMDQEIKAAGVVVSKLKSRRAKLEAKLLRLFKRQDIDGARGKVGVSGTQSARFPTVKNRAKLERYILKHRALDLLQNRINSRAYFDRLEEGEEVPGVSVFERVRVSVRKRK
jgi:hypothetical protein